MSRTTRQDYYTILEVSPQADQKEISANYKKLVARYHPDRHMNNELHELAEEKIKQLNQAYEILSDRSKRQAYDWERSANTTESAKTTIQPVWLRRLLPLVVTIAITFLSLRLIRNPRVIGLVVLVLAFVWLGNYLRKRFRNRK